MCIYIHIYICRYIHVFIYIFTYIYICICTYIFDMHIYTYTIIQSHVYIHTYTHTAELAALTIQYDAEKQYLKTHTDQEIVALMAKIEVEILKCQLAINFTMQNNYKADFRDFLASRSGNC